MMYSVASRSLDGVRYGPVLISLSPCSHRGLAELAIKSRCPVSLLVGKIYDISEKSVMPL